MSHNLVVKEKGRPLWWYIWINLTM